LAVFLLLLLSVYLLVFEIVADGVAVTDGLGVGAGVGVGKNIGALPAVTFTGITKYAGIPAKSPINTIDCPSILYVNFIGPSVAGVVLNVNVKLTLLPSIHVSTFTAFPSILTFGVGTGVGVPVGVGVGVPAHPIPTPTPHTTTTTPTYAGRTSSAAALLTRVK
jgi:hypothetical protein